jgi:hypothetical protein
MQQQPKNISWKKAMLQNLIHDLYAPIKQQLETEISALLEEHRRYLRISNTQTLFSYFEGMNYKLLSDDQSSSVKYVDLDPKFHESVRVILVEHAELKAEEAEMKAFFRKVMNNSINRADVAALVPDSLYKAPVIYEKHLTEKQITKFLKENSYYTALITRRMVENLLAK